MNYDAKLEWNKAILASEMAYPAEYVIRMFKGTYPRLDLAQNKGYKGKKICDLGCGDGRNMVLLKQCGFDVYGTEITKEIVQKAKENLALVGITGADIRVGANDTIPFDDGYFDYLLSWNSCYYMGKLRDFAAYVKEYARALKKDGLLVMSIPKKTCFIYKGAERIPDGYAVIKNDPFNIRNGEVLRMFEGTDDIVRTFGGIFGDFNFASIEDDCFGFDYHWHLVVCRKK